MGCPLSVPVHSGSCFKISNRRALGAEVTELRPTQGEQKAPKFRFGKGKQPAKAKPVEFLDLPPELRLRIYHYALVPRPSNDDIHDRNHIISDPLLAPHIRDDMVEEIENRFRIRPGFETDQTYKNILLVNKFINEEATPILYSDNVFMLLLPEERDHTYSNPMLFPHTTPEKNVALVRHLYLKVHNFPPEHTSLLANYGRPTLPFSFQFRHITLLTLAIRYTNRWGGVTDEFRSLVDETCREPLPSGMLGALLWSGELPLRLVLRSSARQRNYFIGEAANLAFLKDMRAKDFTIRGDISQGLMDRLRASIEDPTTTKEKEEAAAAAKAMPRDRRSREADRDALCKRMVGDAIFRTFGPLDRMPKAMNLYFEDVLERELEVRILAEMFEADERRLAVVEDEGDGGDE